VRYVLQIVVGIIFHYILNDCVRVPFVVTIDRATFNWRFIVFVVDCFIYTYTRILVRR